MQNQLKNVQQIQASSSAFAAIVGDGSVVTWGSAGCGGNSNSVQNQLKNVQQIKPPPMLLPPLCVMDLSSHGAVRAVVVTAVPSKAS